MKQTRALGPDIATFTCACMYQSLFSLCNNPSLGSFHHLPPLPALLPALLADRAVLFGDMMGRLAPTLERV